jgi:hypothetical protein
MVALGLAYTPGFYTIDDTSTVAAVPLVMCVPGVSGVSGSPA